MADYRALDLSACCNVGAKFHTGARRPLTGRQTFHGLPFRIAEKRNCFIGFGGDRGPAKCVTVRIASKARHVIVAHALLESRVTHAHPEPDHRAFLEQPFHEAIAAIHRRLHAAGLPH